MSTTAELAVRNGSPVHAVPGTLAISTGQAAWDDHQRAALAQLGLKDAPDGDLSVFLHQCQRTGLDPFARQIYMIGRQERVPHTQNQWRTKWTIQTGIEGWRVIRDRAERREGVRGKLSRFTYYDPEGNEYKVWVRREPPVACEVTYTVRDRNGVKTPYTSVLRFSEYVQTRDDGGKRVASAQWAPDAKPVHMLEKCTEADAYRKAFPQDFAGIHLDDAMPPPGEAPAPAPEPPRVTSEQVRARRTVAAAAVPADPPPAPPHRPPAAADPPVPGHPPGEADGAGGAPALIGRDQKSEIEDHFKRIGADLDSGGGWDAMLAACARLAGLAALASLGELTQDEAARIIRQLKPLKDGEAGARALQELLRDGVKAVPDGQ